ncbi:MAG TPA: Ig-like domain-containing protein, partial [Iamia sp.]
MPLVFALALGTALAYWSATTAPGGHGASGAATVGAGQTPTATAGPEEVAVSWAASTLSSGDAVDGYVVARYDVATLTAQTILSACTGTVSATSCVEADVPVGEWVYTVTPVVGTSWQGAESTESAPVVVGGSAPIAAPDDHTVAEDGSLAVPAPGVLANDTSADPLTAVLVTGVAHGTLTLAAGGGFDYVPEADFAGVDSFTYRADDGDDRSDPATVTLTVTAVNDAPVNHVPGAQQTPRNTNRVFSSATHNPLTISDVDAGGATVEVQLTATNGTVTLPVLTGLTFTSGDGTADATMTFRGTIVDINLRLGGAWFTPTTNFTGAASLQVVGRDLGNVGTGGTLSDTDSIAITVNALGIFTANQDIGGPTIPGSSAYSAGTYTISGSGA